ncbi:hypothetical protein [Conexibacter woesei]|uniref:Uncharacterized protein n=1 Tax=Conexibacter woesei (strain DSM 14684 / CCUG 47730 / CIP 108061 / JCM 11494 / NBRC 100937 / ID131577) TaxID=469383 RepID=D3FC82_CONWI|nr:hypothetical protein [Conexibacter woesei]ADB53377.1 hypothetical protein Cwoe_4966 [Conexibacter woesei DSM 14684]
MAADAPLAQDGAGAAPVVEQVVNYHFPVEVELVGTLSDDQRRDVAEFVYQELDAALEGQG